MPLPPLPPDEWLAWNLRWGRDHLVPWISRRLRRVSSGDGRVCKHPSWVTVAPAATPAGPDARSREARTAPAEGGAA